MTKHSRHWFSRIYKNISKTLLKLIYQPFSLTIKFRWLTPNVNNKLIEKLTTEYHFGFAMMILTELMAGYLYQNVNVNQKENV